MSVLLLTPSTLLLSRKHTRGLYISALPKVTKHSHHEETKELPGERDNARNNARCTQARKTTHGLDGQHQNVVRTPRGRVISQNDRGQK